MASLKSVLFYASVVSLAIADDQIGLCTSDTCGECPVSLTTTGKGYPACVIYDRDTVLGNYKSLYPPEDAGNIQIGYDIPAAGDSCRTIIRTPANTDDINCGVPEYAGKGDLCIDLSTQSTLLIQFCCGTGDCSSAGAEKRDGAPVSKVLYGFDGLPIMPLAVGHSGIDMMEDFLADMGFNASTILDYQKTKFKKRGISLEEEMKKKPVENAIIEARQQFLYCETYEATKPDYTKTGDVSTKLTGDICGANRGGSDSTVMISNTQSTSETTTFGGSITDPFGIISASAMYSFEKSASQDQTYAFDVPPNNCGHVVWTPFFNCTYGTIHTSECGNDESDEEGEACTAKRVDDKSIDGQYSFVIVS